MLEHLKARLLAKWGPTHKRHVETLRGPCWADAEHKGISCWVKFAEFDEEYPFIAMPDDPEPHGRDIYRRLIDGKAGPIAEYEPPAAGQPQGAPRVLTH